MVKLQSLIKDNFQAIVSIKSTFKCPRINLVRSGLGISLHLKTNCLNLNKSGGDLNDSSNPRYQVEGEMDSNFNFLSGYKRFVRLQILKKAANSSPDLYKKKL